MRRRSEEKPEEDEFEIIHARKPVCSCDEDEDYCEVHNDFV